MSDGTILIILGFVGELIAVITPVIKLYSGITKLTLSIDSLREIISETKGLTIKHEERLNDHETRLQLLEKGRKK